MEQFVTVTVKTVKILFFVIKKCLHFLRRLHCTKHDIIQKYKSCSAYVHVRESSLHWHWRRSLFDLFQRKELIKSIIAKYNMKAASLGIWKHVTCDNCQLGQLPPGTVVTWDKCHLR